MSYTIIDNHIFEIDVNPYSKLVYVALCKYANQNGVCFPSMKTLSKVTGIKSKHTIIKAINELLQYGLIEVVKGKHNSNTYIIKSQYYLDNSNTASIDNVNHSSARHAPNKHSVHVVHQSKNKNGAFDAPNNNVSITNDAPYAPHDNSTTINGASHAPNTSSDFDCNNTKATNNNCQQILDKSDIQTANNTTIANGASNAPNECLVHDMHHCGAPNAPELYLYKNNKETSNNSTSYNLEDQLSLDKLLDLTIEENKKKKNNIETENKSLLEILELQERKIKQNRERIYKEILENK